MEPSTATVLGPGAADRKSRPATRPGPRSSKIKGSEKEKELTDDGIRSRSNSRNRRGEDDGKGNRERRREIGAGSHGYDTADEVGMDELGPRDDAMSEASQPSVEPWGELSTASAPPEPARGWGRPPAAGKYVGLARAKRELAEAEERSLVQEMEREAHQSGISQLRRQRRERPASGETDPAASPGPMDPEDATRRSVADLGRGIAMAAGAVDKVASRSKNLKGTFVKELRVAANETREIFAELRRRLQTTGDVPGLRAENAALHSRVEQLGGELREMRAVVETLKETLKEMGHALPSASLGMPAPASFLSVVSRKRAGSTDQSAPARDGGHLASAVALGVYGEHGQRERRPKEAGARWVLDRRCGRGAAGAQQEEEKERGE